MNYRSSHAVASALYWQRRPNYQASQQPPLLLSPAGLVSQQATAHGKSAARPQRLTKVTCAYANHVYLVCIRECATCGRQAGKLAHAAAARVRTCVCTCVRTCMHACIHAYTRVRMPVRACMHERARVLTGSAGLALPQLQAAGHKAWGSTVKGSGSGQSLRQRVAAFCTAAFANACAHGDVQTRICKQFQQLCKSQHIYTNPTWHDHHWVFCAQPPLSSRLPRPPHRARGAAKGAADRVDGTWTIVCVRVRLCAIVCVNVPGTG